MSSSSADGPYAPPSTSQSTPTSETPGQSTYWSQSLRIVVCILAVWAFISLGCGVLFREWLDAAMPNVGGAPFGFWMAQQGSIIGFLVLLVVYMLIMNRLDNRHGYSSGAEFTASEDSASEDSASEDSGSEDSRSEDSSAGEES